MSSTPSDADRSSSPEESLRAWTRALVAVAGALGRSVFEGSSPPDDRQPVLESVYLAVGEIAQGRPVAEDFRPLLEANGSYPLDAAILAGSYERLLDDAVPAGDGRHEPPGAGRRKATGSYFTPPALVRLLIEASVLPVLQQRVGHSVFAVEGPDALDIPPLTKWTAAERDRGAETLLGLTVCDPACGPGCFLTAVVETLAERLALLRYWDRPAGAKEVACCRREVARRVVFGVDRDQQCIALARLALWLTAGRPEIEPAELAPHLRQGDSLGISAERPAAMLLEDTPGRGQPAAIDWPARFPHVFAAGGFDVVIGNPPFANAIEGLVDGATKRRLGEIFPELGGTADLAYYFLALADRITRPEGAIGLVLPRSVLTSRATRRFRERLTVTRPPTLLYAPQNQHLFHGADIYVVLLTLRHQGVCLAGWDATIDSPRLTPVRVDNENWWAPIVRGAEPERTARREPLESRFEVFASMTAGMAYDVLPFLSDDPRRDALKFVTTGLIDPEFCHWGKRVCRYLKKRFEQPYVHESAAMPAYLAARLEKVKRPKVLVAGLSNRVEAYFDAKGEYCGAVSTFTILHPDDNQVELAAVCAYLNSAEPTRRLHLELGASAMSGGRITLNKDFLRRLPSP